MTNQFVLLAIFLCALQSGCSSFGRFAHRDLVENSALANNKMESPENPMTEAVPTVVTPDQLDMAKEPANMATIWKEDVAGTTGKAVRGFTGRVYFYDSNRELVKVDGELTVYGYDDSLQQQTNVPQHEYRYTREQLSQQYSPSEIGHSYVIWIPWEDYGGYRKSVTLIPMFRTSTGRIVQGSMNRLSLTGKKPEDQTQNVLFEGQVNRAKQDISQFVHEYQQQKKSRAREVESLQVPRNLGQKLSKQNYDPIVNQRLDQLTSQRHNPNGELFNQSDVDSYLDKNLAAAQAFQNSNAAAASNHQQVPHQHGTYANLNDNTGTPVVNVQSNMTPGPHNQPYQPAVPQSRSILPPMNPTINTRGNSPVSYPQGNGYPQAIATTPAQTPYAVQQSMMNAQPSQSIGTSLPQRSQTQTFGVPGNVR
ncbi:MAG: hypothetical protein AAGA30_01565 [Planctomycetota bacterium]